MPDVDTAAGSRLYIGPVADKAVDTLAELVALTPYVEVGEIENMGEFGDQVAAATFTALNNRRVRKFKTSYDAGTMQLTIGFDDADAGQDALAAALATDDDYAIRVTLDNGSPGSPSSPTTFYFKAKVMSRRINPGAVDNIVRATVELAINSAVFEVASV